MSNTNTNTSTNAISGAVTPPVPGINPLALNRDSAAPTAPGAFRPGDVFMNISAFEAAQRMVAPLAKSDLVPTTFQNRIGNCLIALELAQRIGASPLAVMQNLYIVHGKPAWSSQFLIGCINASKKFTPLRYRMTGTPGADDRGCIAWALDASGETLETPEVTIKMAKSEGWFSKNGSKWQTMPELMLRYRCATLFARLYAPELTMGIQTDDEAVDTAPVVTEARPSRFESPAAATVVDVDPEPRPQIPPPSDIDVLQAELDRRGFARTADEVKKYVENNGEMFSCELIIPNLDAIINAMGVDNGK